MVEQRIIKRRLGLLEQNIIQIITELSKRCNKEQREYLDVLTLKIEDVFNVIHEILEQSQT
ncbi:hypothetical protein CW713_06975 [Methanophagales archaeon]|nr:MAG: hypothetical protein CW713_06975 [Methanophagales archaeon]